MDDVITRIDGAVATITLNRPAALNTLNAALRDGLVQALTDVENDAAIRVVVLTGAGGHFMAGGDIRSFAEQMDLPAGERRDHFEDRIQHVHPIIIRMRRMPKPIVASVRGAVAGFGMSLLMGCDLAVAAEDSLFTLAYCHLGTTPDGGATWFLPRMVGMKRAMEIALLGDRFDAATAERLGLVNRVVPTAELETATTALAERLAKGPALAYAGTKRLLQAASTRSLEAQLQAEAESFSACAASEDFKEGVTAFLAKRAPTFTGH
ncbi:MAG TPA: enoyl-CoA hydratase [Stellaceae bacterium]|nr:enoyl-CoA hydratase [Stellaceae bacterium]